MKIEQVWAIYFSGTGNTQKVVRRVAMAAAKGMGCYYEERDFSLPQAREETKTFGPEDLVVVGVPVYAGRVPNVLLPYLTKKLLGKDTLAVPVCTYGNRNFDDALIELRDILENNGFRTIRAGAFVGEHSFSKTLGAGRPDALDMSLAAMLGFKACELAKELQAPPAKPVKVDGETPIRPYYTPRDRNGTPINILKVKPKTDPDKCVNCGLCAKLCTMGSIDPQDVSQVTGICIKCCACVKKCPKGAKYFDDEGYLYHQHELEEMYARRAQSRLFLG